MTYTMKDFCERLERIGLLWKKKFPFMEGSAYMNNQSLGPYRTISDSFELCYCNGEFWLENDKNKKIPVGCGSNYDWETIRHEIPEALAEIKDSFEWKRPASVEDKLISELDKFLEE